MDEQKMEQKPDERRLPERLLAIQNELKAERTVQQLRKV